MRTESLEDLERQLQGMRWSLEQYRSGERSGAPGAPELSSILLDRYDATLKHAADLLDIRDPGITMPDEIARADLEDALVASGMVLVPRPGGERLVEPDDVLDLRTEDGA